MSEIESLIKMANQIARNFAFHEDSIERIADHLQRFWAPSMRRTLNEYIRAGGEGVAPEVRQAVESAE